jgi:hypothetical protein
MEKQPVWAVICRRALNVKDFSMKNFQKTFGVIAVLSVIVMTSLLTAGCATGYKAINTYQDASLPKEEHARLFIGIGIQVIGIDGKMSPLSYIASGGNVILLPPGKHTVNVNHYDSQRDMDVPRYPGEELSFTVEAGKIYVVSTNNSTPVLLKFYLRELDNIPDNETDWSKGFFTDKETLKTQIEEAVSKL